MIIELRGVEFVNKGAELMLHAVIQELRHRIPGVQFAMEASNRAPVTKLRENSILRKANFLKYGIDLTPIFNALPSAFLIKKGYAKTNDIEAILDGSGFAYGDKWGSKKAGDRAANFILDWKREGKKVILLPQAFGPFSKPDLREKMDLILSNSDLVFARDSQSFKFLEELGAYRSLKSAPDFTNLITGAKPKNDFSQKIAVIPNQKMMETDDELVNRDYVDYLVKTVGQLQKRGEEPFFLIHESQKDGAIANQANESMDTAIPILLEEDPLKVKGVIGACRAVITSRFHGLVSALCQSVPCLSTGWSHKYKELLEDYQYSEGLSEVSLDEAYINDKLNLILEKAARNSCEERLDKNSKLQKMRSNEMWDQTVKVLTSA